MTIREFHKRHAADFPKKKHGKNKGIRRAWLASNRGRDYKNEGGAA